MVLIICKGSFAKSVRAIHRFIFRVFLQIKWLFEIESWSCCANGLSNCSSTSSKILFHGLPSKSKRPNIRKQIIVIITVHSLFFFFFLQNSHLERYIFLFQTLFPKFFHEILVNSCSASKNDSKIFRKFTKEHPWRSFILVKLQAFTETATEGLF